MTTTTDSPAEDAWIGKVKKLTPDERKRRLGAVDILLDQPEDVGDVLEGELWTLREHLSGRP